ncbi:hypothetical protein KSP40_PGU008148 [Platanthera guangdongensis]|uniref:cysteine dioxygenase n=1 Tax=Platanthera guangdongensis TaxID=2320717 RepID=A0ABR2MHN0_9ASPA
MAPGFQGETSAIYPPPDSVPVGGTKFEVSLMGEKRMAADGKGAEEERIARKRRGGGGFYRPPRLRRVLAEEASAAIRRIYAVSRSIFNGSGTVPSPEDVQLLQFLLDKMKPEDVGLSTDILFLQNRSASRKPPAITFTTIHICDNFSMCVFFLPPAAVIPLHNHPGMTVFSKLLLGTMHITSYDLVGNYETDKYAQSPQLKLAQMVEDSDFTAPCKTSILYPTTGGNIHTFRAITWCAVLDIIGPPYSKEDGRDCTYYKDHPYTNLTGGDLKVKGSFGWLEEVEIPKSLKLIGIEYLGPRIIDS